MSDFLRSAHASRYLEETYGIRAKPATLAKWRSCRGGPRFRYDGRFAIYAVKELDDWAHQRLGRAVRSTSDGREVA